MTHDTVTATTNLDWQAPAAPGGTALLYDTLRSERLDDFGAVFCLESDGGDTASIDDGKPPGGVMWSYLVRAENSCGMGSPGHSRSGAEHMGTACP